MTIFTNQIIRLKKPQENCLRPIYGPCYLNNDMMKNQIDYHQLRESLLAYIKDNPLKTAGEIETALDLNREWLNKTLHRFVWRNTIIKDGFGYKINDE